jgi:hypothetical protein
VTEVHHAGVHSQDLSAGVAELQLDRQGDLLDLDGHASPARRVKQLRQLLIERRAALVTAASDPGKQNPRDRDRVDSRLGSEPMVLRRDQCGREPGRNRRAEEH